MENVRKRKFESPTHAKVRKAPQPHQQKPQIVQPHQFRCNYDGCKSTFPRRYNLVRHQETIHGPKRKCPHAGCPYASGRKDKLKEHIARMHAHVTLQKRQVAPADMCVNELYNNSFCNGLFIETTMPTMPNPSGDTITEHCSLCSSLVDFNGVGVSVPSNTSPVNNKMPYEYYENNKEVFQGQEYVTLQEISFRS